MADSLRYLVLLLCLFSIGTLAALYERVGRFLLPKLTIRLLIVACALFFVTVLINVGEQIGQPFRFRILITLAGVVIYVTALAQLYHWFNSEEGRKRRHAIINEYAAHELHELADLARALEEDPDHVGRYVPPSIATKALTSLRARRPR